MNISQFRQQYPQYNDLTDAQLVDAVHQKFYPDIPRSQVSEALGQQSSDESDVGRGFGVAMGQIKPLAEGAIGLVGATAEKGLGAGGVATAVKEWGLRGYQEGMAKLQPQARENDDITVAWGKAKEGDLGALIDWAQYGVGYSAGQLVQSGATAAVGGLLGTMVGGPVGAAGGAAAGAVEPTLLRTAAQKLIQGAVAKEAAKLAESEAGRALTAEALQSAATKAVTSRIGQAVGLGGFAGVQEMGSIYPEAEAQAKEEGRQLDGADLARVWGTGAAAAALEGLTDKLGVDALLGRVRLPGTGGRVTRGLAAGAIGAGLEAGTEGAQTVLERAGAGQSMTDQAAISDYINSAALGAIGGGPVGLVAGAMHRAEREGQDQENMGRLAGAANVDDAIAAFDDLTRATSGLERATAEWQRGPESAPPSVDQGPGNTSVAPTGFVGPQQFPVGPLEQQRQNLDRQADLLGQAANAGFSFDRENAQAQEAAARGGPTSRGAAAEWADLAPMDLRQARARLTVLRDEAQQAGQQPMSLVIANHPNTKGKLAIRQLPSIVPATPVAPTGPSTATVANRIETAALTGKNAARKAEDEPRQQIVSRAMQSIESRGGVASPDEARIVQEAGLGKPYDRIDESLATPLSQDEKLTQATGIALGRAPRETIVPGKAGAQAAEIEAETAAADTARTRGTAQAETQRVEANDRRAAEAERMRSFNASAKAVGDKALTEAANRPQEAPSATSVVAALRARPFQRTPEQKALIAQSRRTRPAEHTRMLESAANAPFELSATDKLTLKGIGYDVATDERASGTHASPHNELSASRAQVIGGNATLGHLRVAGMDISVENDEGSVREDKANVPPKWRTTMRHHYGYIKGTVGKDKDHVDAFVVPGTPENWDGPVFVVDQRNEKGGFDEHKVVLGANTVEEARQVYLSNYSKGWTGLKNITEFSLPAFKAWVYDRNATKQEAATAGRKLSQQPTKQSAQREPQVAREQAPRSAIEALAKVFGHKVEWFTDENAGGGFVNTGDPRTIHLNTLSNEAHLVVLGHEVLHHLKAANPKAYDALLAAIEPLLKKEAGETFERYYGKGANTEELIADLLGNRLAEPEFLQSVFAEIEKTSGGGKLVRAVAAAIRHVLDAMTRALGKLQGFDTDELVSDLDKVRDALKSALAEYTVQQRESAAAPSSTKRSEKRNPISVVGYHYSKEQRKTIDSAYAGSNYAGAERERGAVANRVNFYVDTGHGIKPESGVGAYAHRATLSNLYDAGTDPEHLKEDSKGPNDFERRVTEAGYAGYYAPDFRTDEGAVVMLGQHRIPVEYVGRGALPPTGNKAERATRTDSGWRKTAEAFRKAPLPMGSPAGSAWGGKVKQVSQALYDDMAASGLWDALASVKEPMYRDDVLNRFKALASKPQEKAPAKQVFSRENIEKLLELPGWAVLTAEDPAATKATTEYNEDAMRKLRTDLEKLGADVLDAVGKYGDVQNAFAVTGITEEQALQLGQKYGQESVLLPRGLVYSDGRTMAEAKDVQTFDKPPEDFYTEIPSTGVTFSVDMKWSEKRKSLEEFHKGLLDRVKANVETTKLLVRQHDWKYNIGDNFLSMKTGKTYEITGRTFNKQVYEPGTLKKLPEPRMVPAYHYSGQGGEERGTFIESALVDSKTMINLTTPKMSTRRQYVEGLLTESERAKLRDATAQRVVDMFNELPSGNELAAVAYAGRAKRGWYERSARAISQVYGPDAPRFAALLASLSPQNSVEMNFENAVRVWAGWVEAGRPSDERGIKRVLGKNVVGDKGEASVLQAWVPNSIRALTAEDPTDVMLSGPKVDSFMRNLLGDVESVTLDAWMANFALVEAKMFSGALTKSDPGKSTTYLAYSARVREAARALTKLTDDEWSPAEVQETVWSWAKTVFETQAARGEPRGARELIMDKAITHEMIAGTPDFGSMFTEEKYAKHIRRAGLSHDQVDAEGTKPGAASEARPFADETQQRYELQAARRLEKLHTEGSAAFRGRDELTGVRESTRRQVLMAAAGVLTTGPARAGTTLSKAKPLSTAILEQALPANVAKILRGNGATSLEGAKAITAAMNEIAKSGPIELRGLARKIVELMPTDGSTPIMLTVDDRSRANAHGAVTLKPFPHLQLFTAEGRTGLTYDTFMHETLHLVVASRYKVLASAVIRGNDAKLGVQAPAAAKSLAQFRALWHEFEDAVKANPPKDKETKLSVEEAVGSPDEFFVRALTDGHLQAYMAGIEYEGASLLQRFKDWVTGLFVKSGVRPSWLDAATLASRELTDEMPGDKPDFARLRASTALADRKESPRRHAFGQLTPGQEQALRDVGGLTTQPTVAQRWQHYRTGLGMRIKQQLVDQFAPLMELDPAAYMKARMANAADGTLEAAMLYGRPFLNGGVPDVDIKDPLGGFANVLGRLEGEHDRLLWWVASQRADKLKAIGLENLFSTQNIAEMKTLDQGTLANGASRSAVYQRGLDELTAFNEAVLKFSRDSGLIDDAAYQLFKDSPYVPFYRVMEDESVQGPRFSSGLVNQRAWKKLKGGSQKLNDDLLANVLQNWGHLYAAAAKNRAAVHALRAAEALGVAFESPGPGKGTVRVMENGIAKHFLVDDPAVNQAVTALEYVTPSWFKPLSTFKRWLTIGVTASPAFKIRNLLRDSISAVAQSSLSVNPLKNIAEGWADSSTSSQVYASMLASGGVIRFGSMLEGDRATRAHDLISRVGGHVLNENTFGKLLRQMHTVLHAYNELGDRSENVNRVALYKQLVAKGHSHEEASFMSRDLLDFSMSGRAPVVRFLAQTVPFFNARLQGLYKLGRAAKEDPARFTAVTSAVIMASMALMLAYQDDEDWKKREDWDRDAYWWFKIGDTAYRIPKPFEVGAIGTLAERTWEMMFDKDMTARRYGQRLSSMLFQTFAFDPTPQIVKPLLDVYANQDSFTGRPIETEADRALRPQDRITESTTQAARVLGLMGLPDPAQLAKGRYAPLSPVQIDYMTRAYFGWMGATAVAFVDAGMRPLAGRGERPDYTLKDLSLGFAESQPGSGSRYVTAFYEQTQAIEEAWASYQAALKRNDGDAVREILADEGGRIGARKLTESMKRDMAKINAQMRLVEGSPAMGGDAKRAALDALRQQRSALAQAGLSAIPR